MFRVESRIAEHIFAMLQMLLHLFQHLRRERRIQVAGDVVPHVFAVYDHAHHLRLGATCFNSGANFFCRDVIRARCKRTFTAAMLMPSAAAASLTLSCSMSLAGKLRGR